MSYAEELSKHRRITMLRYLREVNSANDSILLDICRSWKVKSSRDQVVSDILWMTDNRMVKHTIKDDVYLVTILQYGEDIATRELVHPGVKAPSFGA